MRYIQELEHKVQVLQTEATTLSAQLTMLQVCYVELVRIIFWIFGLSLVWFKLILLCLFAEGLSWTGHSEQ